MSKVTDIALGTSLQFMGIILSDLPWNIFPGCEPTRQSPLHCCAGYEVCRAKESFLCGIAKKAAENLKSYHGRVAMLSQLELSAALKRRKIKDDQ